MSIQPSGAAASYPLALPVKKPRVSEIHTMDSLPKEVFGKILHCLDLRDLQAMASLSTILKTRVITEVSDSEPPALINFIKRLIQGLYVARFSRERGDLTGLVGEISRNPFGGLRLLKEGGILPVKNQIIGVIKRLDDETLATLESQVKPPKFMGNVFTLAHHQSVIEEAQRIQDKKNREQKLLKISKDLLAISRKLIGSRKFDEAIDIAKLIPDTGKKQAAYRDVSIALAEAGNFDGAIDIARLIVSDGSYASEYIVCEPFKRIFYFLLVAENFGKASHVAMMIPDSQLRSESCIDLSRALKKVKDFDNALDVAGSITPRWMRNDMIKEIAMALAVDGSVDRAVFVIKSYLGVDEDMWVVFHGLCKTLADIKNFDKATEIAISHLDGEHRSYALKYISRRLADGEAVHSQCTVSA
ncbi:MAG: hypothetical protein NTX49_02805 [Chlamydiae bacterium]|nr:hypothetical protein [Chlamydiota bacterium]